MASLVLPLHRTPNSTFLFCFSVVLFSFSSPAFGQQRIIIEKETGNVVDVGDRTLQYDARYFDNVDYPANIIPPEADFRKYIRDAKGDIVLRPANELKGFTDEWRSDLTSRINALLILPDAKAFMPEIEKAYSDRWDLPATGKR